MTDPELREAAREVLLHAIAELRDAGIPVPVGLLLAVDALRSECTVLPFKPRKRE